MTHEESGADGRVQKTVVKPLGRVPSSVLETGTQAPTFELETQDGESVSLSSFDGQRVVLYFYPRADTPGCTREAKSFRDHLAEFAEYDVAVVGVSDDPVADLASFDEKYDLGFTLLSDPDGSVGAAYDSYGERTIGDREMEITHRNTYLIGPDGEIERSYEGVSPDEHPEDVLADLADLAE